MALQCIRQREAEYMESSATSNRAMMTVGCSATPNKGMVRCHVISQSIHRMVAKCTFDKSGLVIFLWYSILPMAT